MRGLIALLAIAMVAMLAVACGDDDDDDDSATESPSAEATETAEASASASESATTAASATASSTDEAAEPLEGEILVFAASSLTDAFNALGEGFTEANPDTTVTFNFAASSALSTQINEGAPADVFASADGAQMRVVTEAGNAGDQVIFATNVPVVVVPAGTDTVATFTDLATEGIRLVLAGPDVPIGRYAREILTKASSAADGPGADFSDLVLANLQSDEANVRAVLTKVQLGEADAGIVYATDATIGGDEVETVEIPEEFNVIAQYPIAVTTEAQNPELAQAWVDYTLSAEGQAILAEFGFGAPAEQVAADSPLEVTGKVATPLTLSVADLEGMTMTSVVAGEDEFEGVALTELLAEAGVAEDATEVTFTGADGYAQTVTLADMMAGDPTIITIDDGAPRNIIPGQPPRTWVKLLVSIEVQ